MEQICTGGGNILKPALAHCAKQIEPEQECERERETGAETDVYECVCKEVMTGN